VKLNSDVILSFTYDHSTLNKFCKVFNCGSYSSGLDLTEAIKDKCRLLFRQVTFFGGGCGMGV
jgi:hypothetical protein